MILLSILIEGVHFLMNCNNHHQTLQMMRMMMMIKIKGIKKNKRIFIKREEKNT
jgi:2-phosphoglycerate kinase